MIWLCYLYYTNYNFWVELESYRKLEELNRSKIQIFEQEKPRQKSHNMISSLTYISAIQYISATSQSSIEFKNIHTHTTTFFASSHVFYSLVNLLGEPRVSNHLSLVNLLGEPRVSNHLLSVYKNHAPTIFFKYMIFRVIAIETSIAQRMISYHTALTFLHCNLNNISTGTVAVQMQDDLIHLFKGTAYFGIGAANGSKSVAQNAVNHM
ncbi:hypothetical protein ACJX0J_030901, partial [Zea mays]